VCNRRNRRILLKSSRIIWFDIELIRFDIISNRDPPSLAGARGAHGGTKAEIDINGKTILKFLLDRWQLARADDAGHGAGAGGSRRGGNCFGREVCDPVAGSGPLRGL